MKHFCYIESKAETAEAVLLLSLLGDFRCKFYFFTSSGSLNSTVLLLVLLFFPGALSNSFLSFCGCVRACTYCSSLLRPFKKFFSFYFHIFWDVIFYSCENKCSINESCGKQKGKQEVVRLYKITLIKEKTGNETFPSCVGWQCDFVQHFFLCEYTVLKEYGEMWCEEKLEIGCANVVLSR